MTFEANSYMGSYEDFDAEQIFLEGIGPSLVIANRDNQPNSIGIQNWSLAILTLPLSKSKIIHDKRLQIEDYDPGSFIQSKWSRSACQIFQTYWQVEKQKMNFHANLLKWVEGCSPRCLTFLANYV